MQVTLGLQNARAQADQGVVPSEIAAGVSNCTNLSSSAFPPRRRNVHHKDFTRLIELLNNFYVS